MKRKFLLFLAIVLCMNMNVSAYDTEELSGKISELKGLLSECSDMGLDCPYEKMKITVMEQFTDSSEISEKEIAKSRLDELYEETKTALNQYIDGEKKPMSVPKYITSDIEIDGKNMIAGTTAGRRPVFFVGYGHFNEAYKAFDVFSDIGANITQQQIGPWDVVYEASKPYRWSNPWFNSCSSNSLVTNFDSENVRGGEVSLAIDMTAYEGTSANCGTTQSLVLEPNTKYKLTFAAKATCGSNNLFITPFTDVPNLYLTTSSAWKNYSTSFTTGENATGTVTICGGGGSKAYIDNIKLVKDGTSENLIKNGNFEENANRFGTNNEYIISTDNIENKIIPMLESAAENNVAVSLLLSPHYFPGFVKGYYPDINIYHEQHRIIMDKYIETLIPMIKDYPALNDICLTNEPTSTSSTIGGLEEDYRVYLTGKYTDLSGINTAWGTSYASLDAIVMPTEPGTTREFYDWMSYNDTKFAGWHKHLADKVREYMPDAKIHAKMQDYLTQDGTIEYERGRMTWGTDVEKFAEFSDIAGNDAYSNYEYRIEKASGRPISGKMKWYDFIGSINEAPVFNSEDHIIPDYSGNYDDAVAAHVSADIFQGGIHGRSASAIWSWERTADSESLYSGNVMQRPDVMASIGKATLDLNRLAKEVTAFSDKQAEVAIYYSNLERAYNARHMTILDRAHDACLYAGQKAEFVTDNTIDEISDCDVLIIPNAEHVPNSTLEAINTFKNSGKTVILLEGCLKYDEYGKSITFDTNGCVRYNYIYTNTPKDISSDVFNAVDNPHGLKLSDSGGNLVSGLEWNYTEYNGKVLVNVCNYNDTDVQNMKIVYDGEVVEVTDIISGENKGTAFTAKPFEPMILSFGEEKEPELIDILSGYVDYTTDSEGYLDVEAFTQEQKDYISGKNSSFTQFVSDEQIVLSFITDATEFSFDYKKEDTSANYYMEVFVNGVQGKQIELGLMSDEGTFTYKLPGTESRVDVYLPRNGLKLKNFAVSDGKFKAVEGRTKALFYGDSITYGYLANDHTCNTYVSVLSRLLDYEYVNFGVGGYYFDAGQLIEQNVFDPDVIFVAYGINHGNASSVADGMPSFMDRLAEMYPNKKIYLLTPLWTSEPRDYKGIRAKMTEIAANYENVTVIDGASLIPEEEKWFSDGLHPNVNGNFLMAYNIANTIAPDKFVDVTDLGDYNKRDGVFVFDDYPVRVKNNSSYAYTSDKVISMNGQYSAYIDGKFYVPQYLLDVIENKKSAEECTIITPIDFILSTYRSNGEWKMLLNIKNMLTEKNVIGTVGFDFLGSSASEVSEQYVELLPGQVVEREIDCPDLDSYNRGKVLNYSFETDDGNVYKYSSVFRQDSNIRISRCYADGGKIYVNAEHPGPWIIGAEIVAEYYDEDGVMKKSGSVKRTMHKGDVINAAFPYDDNADKIVVKLIASGYVLEQIIF